MNTEQLEQGLRDLTRWEGGAPALWERAVEAGAAQPTEGVAPRWSRQWVYAAAGIAAVLLVTIGLIAPGLGGAHPSRGLRLGKDLRGGTIGEYARMPSAAVEPEASPPASRSLIPSLRDAESSNERASRGMSYGNSYNGIPPPQPDSQRLVVRKATMELRAEDVRAAALQAQQLLSEPKGEYVESADIDDSDKTHPRADLVLRVDATRLEEVLSQLRELGEVTTERVDGEDVTDQMVDLDARIKNERGVEAELLELLKNRDNDKLEDILAVRRELNSVRERIERLAAQQANLSKMVRLARVAVMIRAEAAAPEPKQGAWGSFIDRLGEAWADGLDALLGTVAGLVRVLVGGAIWFGIAAVAGVFAWRGWRRRHPRPLPE